MQVEMVDSCLRNGTGGSPTAVVLDGEGRSDRDLADMPGQLGASHVAVVDPPVGPSAARPVRFFTAEGELSSCGHGTVAAIAVLSSQASPPGFLGLLGLAGQNREAVGFPRAGTSRGDPIETWFDQGTIDHRAATPDELGAFLAALGLPADALHPDDAPFIASPGHERMLIPVADRTVLARVDPDHARLAAESRRLGQLGCFVYVPPSYDGRAVGRMFAPAVGVPEDVANANSCGCLAAHLAVAGREAWVVVEQGDAAGRPSTVRAIAHRTSRGIVARVGGTALVR